MLIDTHAHLYADEFKEDKELMIQRALDCGVKKILLPNIDQDSIEGMLLLCKQYPDLFFPMMGLHPCSVDADFEKTLTALESYFQHENKMIAVGETGIDLYWDKTFITQQRESFRIHIHWAKKYNLPLVIHARESFDELFLILDELNDSNLRGIFHCFSGNQQHAEHILSYGGFKMGIGGVVTFKNSGVDQVLKSIPIEHLVLETDAPYLAPVPFRGKRNESAYLSHIVKKLSEIYLLSESQIIEETGKNAKSLFSLE